MAVPDSLLQYATNRHNTPPWKWPRPTRLFSQTYLSYCQSRRGTLLGSLLQILLVRRMVKHPPHIRSSQFHRPPFTLGCRFKICIQLHCHHSFGKGVFLSISQSLVSGWFYFVVVRRSDRPDVHEIRTNSIRSPKCFVWECSRNHRRNSRSTPRWNPYRPNLRTSSPL